VIHWWADSLDGTVARVRHREREKFGYFVDHICDAFSTALICVGLGLSTLVHPGIGLAVAIGYLLMNVYAHVISYVERVFKISYGRIGPTEIRIIFILGTSFIAAWNPVLVRLGKTAFTLGDAIAFTVSAAFLVIFAVSSIKKAVELDKLDRAKWTP
jgi:phosphatidylglycerophosphate synthase